MPTGIELLALGAKTAGKTAFVKSAEQTLTTLSTKTQALLLGRKREQAIAKLFTQLGKVRQVKTLWQVDKPVDIGTFYCESHIYLHGRRKPVALADDLDEELFTEGIRKERRKVTTLPYVGNWNTTVEHEKF